jgi:hypothetical protein
MCGANSIGIGDRLQNGCRAYLHIQVREIIAAQIAAAVGVAAEKWPE